MVGKGSGASAEALAKISGWDKKKYSFGDIEREARAAGDFPSVVDAADRRFFAPESMTAAVCAACAESGQKVPATLGELVQCVYSSLAASYAREAELLASLTGKKYTTLNIVGGGSKDTYLNELTAKATGLEVVAGPTEGTAIGNLIVQMIASGEFSDIAEARRAIDR